MVATKLANDPSSAIAAVPGHDLVAAKGAFTAGIAAAARGGTQLTAAKNAAPAR